MKQILTTCTLVLFCALLNAQENYCGASRSKAQISWLKDFQQGKLEQYSADRNNLKYLPIKAHIVGRDDGTGYYRLSNLWTQICELNEDFEGSGLQFYLDLPLSYLDNTTFYDHQSYWDINQGVNQTWTDGMVNAYFSKEAAGNCGYFSPSHDVVVLAHACTNPGDKTLSHEVGHFFSLPHTFNGWEGGNVPSPNQQEKVNGSNCNYAADGFCDTPPDYAYYRWTCPLSDTLIDPNGDTLDVDGSLIMSYSDDACANRFSNEQDNAMYNNWQYQRTDINALTNVSTAALDTSHQIYPGDGQVIPFNYVKLKWRAVEGAEAYHIAITSFPTFANTTHNYIIEGDTQLTVISDTNFIPKFQEDKIYKWKVKPLSKGYYCADYTEEYQFAAGAYADPPMAIQEANSEKWKLYPNQLVAGEPIRIEGPQTGILKLSCYDALGRTISVQTLQKGESFQTSALRPGLYYLQITEGNQSQTKRIAILAH